MPRLFLVCIARSWKNIQIEQYESIPLSQERSLGDMFMPVFYSKEEAEKLYPNDKIIEVADITQSSITSTSFKGE